MATPFLSDIDGQNATEYAVPSFDWSADDVDLLASWIVDDDEECGGSVVGKASEATSSEGEESSSLGTPPPAVTSSEEDTSRHAPIKKASHAKKDSNTTRQRQRHEMEYLRVRVRSLETELDALRNRGENSTNPTTTTGSIVPSSPPPAPAPSDWQAVAERQQKARERSEVENYKLRAMVESQLKLAQTLERLLRKRDHSQSMEYMQHAQKRRRGGSLDTNHEPDHVVFERLLASIDRSYLDTTQELEANGLWSAPRGHRSINVKQPDCEPPSENGLYVEMTDVATMPFGFDATASAAWRCITAGYMHLDHDVYHGYSGQDNILAIKYAITLARRRLKVDLNARAAMKRFVEKDQIVDVWESISDTDGTHTSPHGARGLRVKERGWTVFRRDPRDGKTVILTCMQMIPLITYAPSPLDDGHAVSTGGGDQDRQVGLLTNLALDYYGDQLDNAQHAMESLLLDETRHENAIADLLPST